MWHVIDAQGKQVVLTGSGSAITSAESSKNTLSLIHHLPSSTPNDATLGMEVVDVYKVDIPMAHRKELNAVTGSNQFRSQHQACAVKLSSQGKSDLLVALGAQGGALPLFMLCEVNEEEEKLTTVISIPSPLRLSSLIAQLNKARITVREWKTGVKKMDSRPSVIARTCCYCHYTRVQAFFS